jgi:glycosyltransferase involved in cell wall biosynthesis
MPEQKKIVIVTTSFAAPSAGKPSAHFLYTYSLTLIRAGWSVDVLMPLKQGLPEREEHGALRVLRFKWPLMRSTPAFSGRTVYDIRSPLDLAATLLMFAALSSELKKYVRTERPDAVWANWLQLGFISKLSVGGRVPVLTTVLGSDVRTFPPPLIRLMARKANDVFNMWAADDEIMSWVTGYRFHEVRVPNVFREKTVSRSGPRDNILVVGRLEDGPLHYKPKGIGEPLFRIIAKVLAERPGVRFTIVGDGSKAARFREMCRDLGDRVVFTGWLDNYDTLIDECRFVIGASGHGGVTFDTIPYGVPVIVSKYDPVEGFWKHGENCLVFDPDDEEDYRRNILAAVDDPEGMERMARRMMIDLEPYAQPIAKAAPAWDRALSDFVEEWKKRRKK